MNKEDRCEVIRGRHYDLAYWDHEWQEWIPLGRHLNWDQVTTQYEMRKTQGYPDTRIVLVETETKITDMTGLVK